jgi:nucleoside-diphosphate-sugar epimerase
MQGGPARGCVLVTGASGQIGTRVCDALRRSGHDVLAVDLNLDARNEVGACDVRVDRQVARMLECAPIRAVLHLAAVLPTAFRADPLAAAEVNLTGTLNVLRHAVRRRVERVIFASSMSVYGSSPTSRALNEGDPATPDEPYGAAKRAIELIGGSLTTHTGLGFVSLRIARVVGPSAKSAASSWRSEIFGRSASPDDLPISIPFAPTARLSLVHEDEVARMLMTLVEAPDRPQPVYNSPVEVWEAGKLAELVEGEKKVWLQTGGAHGGPICDGTRFAQDFGFRLNGLAHYLSSPGVVG